MAAIGPVDLYRVLGVEPTASAVDIRNAYLAAARRHHPDLESDTARRAQTEVRMQEINAAWAVLGDVRRRREYDAASGRDEVGQVPRREWVPFEGDDPDEPDPRDLIDDTPYGDGGRIPRSLQVAPPLLVVVAIGSLLIGSFTAIPGLFVLGLVFGVTGALLFLAVPAFAVFRGARAGTGSEVDDDGG